MPKLRQPHLADDDLEKLAFTPLPGNAAAPAGEHLLLCAECRARLAEWDEYSRQRGRRLSDRLPDAAH